MLGGFRPRVCNPHALLAVAVLVAWAQRAQAQNAPQLTEHQSEVDCSRDTASERCTQQQRVDTSDGALQLGVRQRSVSLLEVPPNGYANFMTEVGGLYGSGDNVTLLGVTAGLGLRTAIGGKLPGPRGGTWHGAAADVSGRYAFTRFEAGEISSSSHLVDAGGTFGYQFYSFGEMSARDFTQSGFGIALGYRVGALFIFGEGPTQDPQLSHGPSLTLSRPEYNAGTTNVSQWFLTALVLPLQDFFVATLSIGASGPFAKGTPPPKRQEGGQCKSHSECRGETVCQAGQCVAPSRDGSSLPPRELPEADF